MSWGGDFWHKPIHHTIRMLGNGQELFYYFCFLGLPFLITIVPLNNLIIVIPIIVIIPYIYLLLSNKPVGEKLQGRRIIFYCLITHFLCFKVIREIVQLPWVYFKGLHSSCVLKQSGTRKNTAGLLRTAWLHVFRVLRWSGTYVRVYGNWATVSLHIFYILKCSGISLIQCRTLS